MAEETLLSIGELAEKAGTTVRTIRYYIAEGLLPSPLEKGARTHYGVVHLERLRIIEELKIRRISLSEINHALQTMSDPEIEAMLDMTPVSQPTTRSGPDLQAMMSTPPAAEMLFGSVLERSAGPTEQRMMIGRGQTDRDVWIRREIVEWVQLHHRPARGRDEEIAINRIVSQARSTLSELREQGKSTSPSRRSKFFHRREKKGD